MTLSEATQALIADQDWLPPLADEVHTLVDQAYGLLPDDGAALSDALHGSWLGHPLHPALTDVPIGAWLVASTLDLAEIFGAKRLAAGADAAVALGLLGSLATLATGWNDWHRIGQRNMGRGGRGRRARAALSTGLVHGLLNETGALLQLGSLLARRKGRRGLGRALSFAALGVTGVAAYLGGQLVFELALGVDE